MQVNQFFLNGDMQGAIAYMRKHGEFKDVLPAYVAIFEHCEWENKILFLKLRKFRIPKQTRFKTLVLLLQPSMKPFDHGDIHGIEDLIRPVAIGLDTITEFEKVHILSFKQPFCEPLFSIRGGLRMDHSITIHPRRNETCIQYLKKNYATQLWH